MAATMNAQARVIGMAKGERENHVAVRTLNDERHMAYWGWRL